MMPGNFTPQGRTHVTLHRLEQTSARVGHLFCAMGWAEGEATIAIRKAFWQLMDFLIAKKLVEHRRGTVFITPAGLAVLAELEAMEPLRPVTAPVYPSRLARMMAGAV